MGKIATIEDGVHQPTVYDGTMINAATSVTLVVAASNSLHPERADYVCDGTADDVQIQAAIDSLPSIGGKVVLLEGNYVLSVYITLPSNTTLEGQGDSTFIDATGLSYSYNAAIRMLGSLSAISSVLTVNITKYDLTATVADASAFSTGDWVRISSLDTFANAKRAELQRIASIAGNVITFELMADDGYLVADTGIIEKATMIEGCIIKDLKIKGWGNTAGCILFDYGYNHSVNNVTLLDFGYAALQFKDCVTCSAIQNIIERSNEASYGYGVMATYCARDISVSQCHFYDCRHAVDFGGGNSTYGVSRNCIANGNVCNWSSQTTYQQFNTHADAEHITFSGNTVIGAQLASVVSPYTLIANNYCEGNNICLTLKGDGTHCSIVNNYLSSISAYCIKILDRITDCFIEGNTIVTAGIGISIATISGHATSNIAIHNNKFKTDEHCIIFYYTTSGMLDSENISIVGNYMFTSTHFAVYIQCTRVELKNILIADNHMQTYRGGVYMTGNTPGSTKNILISNNIFGISSYFASSLGCIQTLNSTIVANLDILNNLFTEFDDGVLLGDSTTSVQMKGNRFDSIVNNEFVNNTGTRVEYANNYSDLYMDVLAVSATHVRSNEDLSAATPITFTLDAQPDIPRTLSWSFDSHAQITEYDMEVIGIDAKGDTITETWDETAGWSGETSNAFATITSIKMTARTGTGAADTMDIGITDVLGLANIIYATSDVFKIKKNNANATVATAQVNTTYDTYDMSVITLGAADDFTIWYKSNLNIIS